MDKAAFSRKFRKAYGVSPKEYLTSLRMNKAKEMLRTTNFEIKEIAASVGYRDQLYFSRLFSKKEGLSPSEYRMSGAQSIFLRNCPVYDSLTFATVSGVPQATIVPPPLPPSGPRSMI